MKHRILDATGMGALILGVLMIFFAIGGADCGDFDTGRALEQVGIGAAVMFGGLMLMSAANNHNN